MTVVDIAEQAARVAHTPQQHPGQPVMMMPPVSYGIGETPDKAQVIIQFQTIYGVQAYPFDPNAALSFCQQVRAKAKELNQGVLKRQGPGGAVLLEQRPALVEDEDEGSLTLEAPVS